MKATANEQAVQAMEIKEDFNWGATIAVMAVLVTFLASIFYVLFSCVGEY